MPAATLPCPALSRHDIARELAGRAWIRFDYGSAREREVFASHKDRAGRVYWTRAKRTGPARRVSCEAVAAFMVQRLGDSDLAHIAISPVQTPALLARMDRMAAPERRVFEALHFALPSFTPQSCA